MPDSRLGVIGNGMTAAAGSAGSSRVDRDPGLGTLLVVYHRPFWRGRDGSLWEREGAFSRYLESLAPHFESILVAAPETTHSPDRGAQDSDTGHRVAAPNVYLAALPFYDGLPRFFLVLPGLLRALWRAMGRADLVNLRLPTPSGSLAYALARLRGKPTFLLVVGDLAEVARSVPADSVKRRLYRGYLALEERLLEIMVRRSLTITNGRALFEKYHQPGRRVFETRNSTIRLADVGRSREPLGLPRARLLCVSRVDPRKGLRYVPLALAALRARGFEPTLDVLGPTVGRLGQEEQAATLAEARRLGLADAVRFHGVASLEQVYQAYERHDVLLVPSLPGEGIPRVLVEAMAAGLPVVATRVAGIPSFVHDGKNGLLVPPADGEALGRAVGRLLENETLRETCVQGGYTTARTHTADAQAAWLVDLIRRNLETAPTERSLPAARSSGSANVVRVTIPLAGLNLSGGVKSLILLANYLAERGVFVRVLVPDYSADPPVPLHPGVELRALRSSGPSSARRLSYMLRLSWTCAAETDVVLANYFLTAYPAFISWLLRGRRAVLAYNIRGYEPWSHGLMAPAARPGRYLRFLLAWLSYRLPFTKLVTTDWLKRMVADPNAVVVGHGIDLEIFRPASHVGPVSSDAAARPTCVGVIGRHGAVKGYADFLAAVQALPADLAARFLVVRADPVARPDHELSEAIEARTEPAMAEFYRRCDIFVFPSLAEGFGLPALEAMACGCAVVTTDCGGVSAYARPDENCLMVPPARPAVLAEAIARLVRDATLRARLARAGVETARAFGREASLDRLAVEILRLARRRAGSSA